MLKLLSRSLLVAVCHWSVVYLNNVWEPVDDECPEKHGIRNFILLDRQRHQSCEGFELADLNEAVDVVVLEKQRLKLGEPLQLVDV